MRFKVGDRVKNIGYSGHDSLGLVGTIASINEDNYTVKFDAPYDKGHSGLCLSSNGFISDKKDCLHLDEDDLELAIPPQLYIKDFEQILTPKEVLDKIKGTDIELGELDIYKKLSIQEINDLFKEMRDEVI